MAHNTDDTLQEFDFTTIPGIGKNIDSSIKRQFTNWRDLLEADRDVLTSVRGVTLALANTLQEQAFVSLQAERRNRASDGGSVTDIHSPDGEVTELSDHEIGLIRRDLVARGLAGDDLEVELQTQIARTIKAKNTQLIRVEKEIDPFTVKRWRIEVTPAVCKDCGLDLVSYFGYESWDYLSEPVRNRLKQTLEQHRQERHTGSGKLIVTQHELDQSLRDAFRKSAARTDRDGDGDILAPAVQRSQPANSRTVL